MVYGSRTWLSAFSSSSPPEQASTRYRLPYAWTIGWSGYTYYTDTLRFHLADQPERFLRPGVLFHEYQAGLARALKMPYTGLFELRLTTLDERPLTGVTAVGLRMKERP